MGKHHHDGDILTLDQVKDLPAGTAYDPQAVQAAFDWCRQRLDSFAGSVVSGDTLYVGFSRNARGHLDALRHVLPGANIKAFVAKFNYAQLIAVKDRISRDLPILLNGGIEISSVGIDDSRNRVVVSVVGLRGPSVEELRRRYGEPILAVESSGRRYPADAG